MGKAAAMRNSRNLNWPNECFGPEKPSVVGGFKRSGGQLIHSQERLLERPAEQFR